MTVAVESPLPAKEAEHVRETYARKPSAILILTGLPPTVNHAYRKRGKGHGMYMTADAKAWKEFACIEARNAYQKKSPLSGRLAVLAVYGVKSRGRWDVDNRTKALLDALTMAKIWEDDKQVEHLNVVIDVDGTHSKPETRVFVWEVGS